MNDRDTIQTIELSGQRYVVLPESEYLTLRSRSHRASAESEQHVAPAFKRIKPLQVTGVPASEMMLRDRQ
jgi:hypothetical protein